MSIYFFCFCSIVGDALNLSNPWVLAGDFNTVVSADEVSQGRIFDARKRAGFRNWIYDHELIDMGYTGPCFTRARGTSTATFKGDRLDRALYNPEWRFLFEIAKVIHLPKLNSDHSPLPIRLREKRILPSKTQFRFQGAWLTHPGLQKVVRDIIGPTTYCYMRTVLSCM